MEGEWEGVGGEVIEAGEWGDSVDVAVEEIRLIFVNIGEYIIRVIFF